MPRVYRFTDEDRERSRQLEKNRRDRINSLPKEWTKDDKEYVLTVFGGACGYCGAPEDGVALEFDHFIDVSDPDCPGTVVGNMVPACRPCNRRKGTHGATSILSEDKYREVANTLKNLGAYWLD